MIKCTAAVSSEATHNGLAAPAPPLPAQPNAHDLDPTLRLLLDPLAAALDDLGIENRARDVVECLLHEYTSRETAAALGISYGRVRELLNDLYKDHGGVTQVGLIVTIYERAITLLERRIAELEGRGGGGEASKVTL